MSMNGELLDKVALVFGGSAGISPGVADAAAIGAMLVRGT
jgi:hypothetical protein